MHAFLDFLAERTEDLVDIVLLLGSAVQEIPQMLSFLPPVINTFLFAFLVIAAFYKFAGREG